MTVKFFGEHIREVVDMFKSMKKERKKEINNCPYCEGSTYLALEYNSANDITNYYVECKECKARGPINQDKDKAIKSWNEVSNG